jgi:3-methyl-2-oxobutanoate hydroxymethyltransferase
MADAPAAVTLRDLAKTARAGGRFACLTCYDATTARWLAAAGIEVLLVGDTAAEVILGHPSTIHAPLEFLVTLTAGVKRGAPGRVVMADMPFMSYQADEAEAVRNAGRFMTEGGADCVKLEADRTFAPLVERDAAALEAAGASMLLVEAVPAEVAEMIVSRATVPVIGCGAGPACHGQVVVLQDLLGLSAWQPSFAKPIVDLGAQVERAARSWRDRVRLGELGEHPYAIAPDELARLQQLAGTTP